MISIRRTVFLICLLLVMGPLALFWAWPHSQLLEQEITAARERNQLVARTLAWSVERYHQDLLGAFNEAADGLIATDPKLPDRLAPRSLKMRHIVVADRQTGAIVTGVEGTQPAPARPVDPDLLARLRAAAADGAQSTVGIFDDTNVAPLLHLVRASGANLIIATVDAGDLAGLVGAIQFGVDGQAMVVDQRGHPLALPGRPWQRKSLDQGDGDIAKRMLAGEAGVGELLPPAFEAGMIAGFAPVRGAGWGVIVLQPIAELRAAADHITRSVLAIFAAGLLIAALIAIRAGAIITAPLHRLNAGARRMAAGDLDARVENEGRGTPRELATLTQSFNDMAEKLSKLHQRSTDLRERAEKANDSKTEFVRTVTHELRSPVNAILGFSDLLTGRSAARISPELRDSYLRDINTGARHLLSLVNDLLDLSKMESGQYELVEQDFWIDEITQRATRYLETQARERHIDITVSFDGEPPMIRGDERALFQALLNLVGNAVRYGHRGGSVTISTRIASCGALEIVVADDGPGIDADDLGRVMLPFQRVHSIGNLAVTGTGLGLPIVKRLVELHGGTFELSSTVGRGTRACIVLPPERIRPAEAQGEHNVEDSPRVPRPAVADAA
jgi:signal transduction histidine kinase